MSSWGGYRVYKTKKTILDNNIKKQYDNQSDIQPDTKTNSQLDIQTYNISKKYIYDKDTAYSLDEFQSSIQRLDMFFLQTSNSKITFVIPTIGRISLLNTLLSLQKQTNKEWNAIIIFDGIIPDDTILKYMKEDSRFYYIVIKKIGEESDIHNRAGYVRNIGTSLVLTEWVAFVDDDDILVKDYIDNFYKEKNKYNCDCIIFRMHDTTVGEIIPREHSIKNPIVSGNIGINFCVKTSLFKSGYLFTQSGLEDFEYINRLYRDKKKILISKYVTYIVRGSIYDSEYKSDQGLSQLLINF